MSGLHFVTKSETGFKTACGFETGTAIDFGALIAGQNPEPTMPSYCTMDVTDDLSSQGTP